MRGMFCVSALVLCTLMLGGAALGQDRTVDLRARFQREPNPVAKAKLMPPLGDAEFAAIDMHVMKEQLPEALDVLRFYRDEVTACDKALDATGVDPDKHPSGFKQLQISLRESLRRLDTAMVGMTTEEQEPFMEIRKELNELNVHLIQQLFPHAPGSKAEQ